jgi:putative flippase GtrA
MPGKAFSGSFLRHQLASVIATAADFGLMVLLVEIWRVAPPIATLFGAALGGCVNFTLNRRYTFRTTDSAVTGQAARYALVSGTSAVLNALGEYAGTHFLRVPYALARVVVAVCVSVGFNYPVHRAFVFSAPAAPSSTKNE